MGYGPSERGCNVMNIQTLSLVGIAVLLAFSSASPTAAAENYLADCVPEVQYDELIDTVEDIRDALMPNDPSYLVTYVVATAKDKADDVRDLGDILTPQANSQSSKLDCVGPVVQSIKQLVPSEECEGPNPPDTCYANCGDEGPSEACECSDPHPPVTCADPDCEDDVDGCGPCTYDDPEDSAYCRAVYCQTNPTAYTCTEETECENGFIDKDSDHDGECDIDDTDDDGDGVDDEDDPSPNANNAVDNAFSCVYWIAVSLETQCTEKLP